MSMGLPSTPAEMRAYIVERLVGETGEPDRVTETARAAAGSVRAWAAWSWKPSSVARSTR